MAMRKASSQYFLGMEAEASRVRPVSIDPFCWCLCG